VPAAARDNSSLSTRCFERILLIKPSSLGDVVHALPVLHGLRARYPDARIEWLIGAAFAQLVEGHPDVDELVLFDRRRFARVGRSFRVTAAFVR
jgi:ADP-heptose:LPS heptosyltransferase